MGSGTYELEPCLETCALRLELLLETWGLRPGPLDLGARSCDLGHGAKARDLEMGPNAWDLISGT